MDPRTHCALDSEATSSSTPTSTAGVRSRGYVGEGQVESLICFLAVQKGASDIRIVYDGTRSGLNDESAHRGIQDAARKRRDVSQTPGAWAGSVVHTTDSSVTIMVDQMGQDQGQVPVGVLSAGRGAECGTQAS